MRGRIAVAAPNRPAADAALALAAAGGSAVDGAVAAMLVAMTNEPGIVSLDAGAYVTAWPAGSSDAVTVDGCVAMPGLGAAPGAAADVREVQTAYGGGVTMTVGPGSAATPGALAALDLAHSRFGRVPWAEVVAPAVDVARDGFPLGPASGYYLPFVRDSVYAWDPQTARSLRGGHGGWVEVGDRMVIDGLAGTLALIAQDGARTMYDGALADVVVADMTARAGRVTRQDLSTYRALVRPALPFGCGDWALRTNPPPAIGGPVLAALLTLAEPGDGQPAAADAARLVEVQRRVLGYRRDRLDRATDRTAAALALLDEVAGRGGARSPSTVQVSVVARDGGTCSITASSGYGSGATVPGTGLWLNNCLGEHELNRGAPPAPGGRLASNMAPTVGRSAAGAVLAIGSPGADRITTALAQVLAPFAWGEASLQAAIDRPRLHVSHRDGELPVRIEVEQDLLVPDLDLPVHRHHPHSMYFGGVAAALLGPDGSLTAAGDPRRAGATAVTAVTAARRPRPAALPRPGAPAEPPSAGPWRAG